MESVWPRADVSSARLAGKSLLSDRQTGDERERVREGKRETLEKEKGPLQRERE